MLCVIKFVSMIMFIFSTMMVFMAFYVNCISAITFLSMLDITTIIYWMCHNTDKTDFMNYFYLRIAISIICHIILK